MITKKLGIPSVIATGVGLIVATSCLIMLSQGVGFAGKGFIIAMAIACFLNILVAFSFDELNAMMTITGGIGQYSLAAVGPFISIISVLGGYFICNAFAASSEAAVIGIIASTVFLPNVSPIVISFVIILGLFVVNLLGIKSFARTQIIVTVFMLGSLLILALMGTFTFGSSEVVKQTSSEFQHLLYNMNEMDKDDNGLNLSELATELGYYDQSHMIKDFNELSNITSTSTCIYSKRQTIKKELYWFKLFEPDIAKPI